MGDIQKQSQVGASVVLPTRRKLIRLGAAVVPVVATLTSQSALAANCISTSAWGSDQISNSASQKARHDIQGVLVTQGYTITAWNAARTGGPATETLPWTALRAVYSTLPNNQNNITFGNLVNLAPTKFNTPTGFFGTDKVVGSLINDDKSFFAVAQLNFVLPAFKPPASCITDANWALILAGNYPTPGSAWSLAQIALYLKNNGFVQFGV